MFYLWPCQIKKTSPQETSKANNLKDMKNLVLPEPSSKGRKTDQRKQAEGTKVTCPISQDATHKFWTNILPGNYDAHSSRKKVALFSLGSGAHLGT